MSFTRLALCMVAAFLCSCTCTPQGITRTRCHDEGNIPFVDLRPFGAEDGAETIWIRGTAPGISEGQVRFFEQVDDQLELICLGVICDERFEIEAPASAKAPVRVSIVDLSSGEAIEDSHQWGALEAPIQLDGTDHEVEIHLGQRPSWVQDVKIEPDHIADVNQVLRREKPPPP